MHRIRLKIVSLLTLFLSSRQKGEVRLYHLFQQDPGTGLSAIQSCLMHTLPYGVLFLPHRSRIQRNHRISLPYPCRCTARVYRIWHRHAYKPVPCCFLLPPILISNSFIRQGQQRFLLKASSGISPVVPCTLLSPSCTIQVPEFKSCRSLNCLLAGSYPSHSPPGALPSLLSEAFLHGIPSVQNPCLQQSQTGCSRRLSCLTAIDDSFILSVRTTSGTPP